MQLSIWTTIYMLISLCYRRLLNTRSQETFEHLVHYLNTGLDSTIPLTFMLGFFVTQVVSRWQSILNALGWIDKSVSDIQHFRHGLATLMKYDWVPIPLLYPQIVFLAVRLYFLICLISRQFIFRKEAKHHHEIDLFVPIGTMIQFIVYVGWMKVAEALLNPMGEDDDDLECNYVIDKNLITGLSLVDLATKRTPEQSRDVFWDNDHIAPLYSMESAKRTVHPLIGSASKIK
uniref:Bestrophin homolog n=1 Tax=Globodera pallida TaxID=36090 RepID=A0A183CJS5_GLOPA